MPMTDKDWAGVASFEDAAEGVFTDPNPPHYEWSMQTAIEYSEKHGIKLDELTDEDLRKIEQIDKKNRVAA